MLQIREQYPDDVYLLMGNHEAYPIIECSPSNFWKSLSKQDFKKYAEIFIEFPLVASIGNIIALHGVLPDIDNLADINNIDVLNPNDKRLFYILWGDFVERDGEYLGVDVLERPKFGSGWFDRMMNKLNKKVLVRAHDTKVPFKLFDDRCITIFDSKYYSVQKRIVMLEPNKDVFTSDDLKIIDIE